MSNRERIIAALNASKVPLDDDELSRRSEVSPLQQVSQICRRLAAAGLVTRTEGLSGKLVNSMSGDGGQWGTQADQIPSNLPAGNSNEQRLAERVMLDALEQRIGFSLQPRRLQHPGGALVEVDGATADLAVLVECWAHQGPAKGGQKYKLVNDATKLWWIAHGLDQIPDRLIICVSDREAIRHLRGKSWQAAAIEALGVEFEVVELPDDWASRIAAAQKRQFR